MRLIQSIMLLTGLSMGGCDGDYFPWLNLVGLGLILGFAALVNRECVEGADENL